MHNADHPLIQQAIQKLLATEYDVIGIVDGGDEVLAAAQQLLPDLVVLDISLPGRSGTRILPEFQATLPSIGIVMLTTQIDSLTRGGIGCRRRGLCCQGAAQAVDPVNLRRLV